MPDLSSISKRKLSDLSPEDKKHWELHLNALKKDSPLVSADVDKLLMSTETLPNLKHPADIHDWFEKPGLRDRLEQSVKEKLNG